MKNRIIFDNDLSIETMDCIINDYALDNDLKLDEFDHDLVINDWLYWDYQDLKDNIDIKMDNDLILLAELNLWNGRRYGYKELDNNLNSVLHAIQGDYFKLVTNNYDLTVYDAHHDGTNFYTVRMFKDISDQQKDNFLNKIYNGTVTKQDISRYTVSVLKDINQAF